MVYGYLQKWLCSNPKGTIFICHGLAEYILRYENLAILLNKLNYNVYSMNYQGHGLSQGNRGYIKDFNDLIVDYLQYIKHINPSTTIPLFLFGHSLGGLISINLAKHIQNDYHNFKGIILSSPALQARKEDAKPILIKVGTLLNSIIPKAILTKLSTNVSDYVQVTEKYKEDILIPKGVSIRTGMTILKALNDLKYSVHSIHYSFLLLQGMNDELIEAKAAQWFYNTCQSKDKTFIKYENTAHELIFCHKSQQVLNDITNWIQKHT